MSTNTTAIVKVQDGSMIRAGDLLGGNVQDEDGNTIKFTQVEGSTIPAYSATSVMNDGSGRQRIYSFGLADTIVRVGATIKNPDQLKAEAKAKESAAAAATTTTTAEPETEKAIKTVDLPTEENKKLTTTADDEDLLSSKPKTGRKK